MDSFSKAKRIVIKIGTSTLTYDTGRINIRRFEGLCKVLSDIKNSGREVILVSSGAVGVGVAKLGLPCRPKDTPSKQAAAAVGQCELMYLYDKLFLEKSHKVAQVLLTADVVDFPKGRENVQNTFRELLSMGAIPVVNENDTVETQELEGKNFGDNDTLSAVVAGLCGAQGLIILTDIDGLYDGDPRKNPAARRIPRVEEVTPQLEALAGGAGSSRGTGGMATKLKAAKLAKSQGIPTAIVSGSDLKSMYRLLEGAGTLFPA